MIYKVVCLLCSLFIFCSNGVVVAKEVSTIGIVGFANRVEITNIDGKIVGNFKVANEYLMDGLVSCDKLDVIDISPEVEKYRMNELVLQLDKSKKSVDCKCFGTDYLIFGYLTNLSIKTSETDITNLKNLSVGGKSETACANLSAKIIDTRTGKVVLTVTGKGESTSSKVAAQVNEHKLKVGKSDVTEECVLNALSKACEEITAKIAEAV